MIILTTFAFKSVKKTSMIGTLVNASAIIVGGSIGLLLKKNFPEKYISIYFQAVGLFTILLGVKMALAVSFPILMVFSLICGGLVGEFFDHPNR